MSLAQGYRIVEPPNIKSLLLRHDAACGCGAVMPAGERAGWDRTALVVRCLDCVAEAESAALDLLLSERDADPALVQHDVKEHETRFRRRLVPYRENLHMLQDRRILRTRSRIDHLIVAPSGVFVVIVKSYEGFKVDTLHTGGMLAPERIRLVVGGRDKTQLISAMTRQVQAVHTALEQNESYADVPVTPLLCVVDGVFPWFGTIDVDGVRVRSLAASVRMIAAGGQYDTIDRAHLTRQLAKHLPPAYPA